MQIKGYIRFTAAALIYTCFAFYLYLPFIDNFLSFKRYNLLLPINSILAATGCYILSRRWIGGFVESLFAGAIFGFGPYFLSLGGKFHPAAGLLAASMPWLFLPAAYVAKANKRWLSIPAGILPFLAILIFFILDAKLTLLTASVQETLTRKDILGLLAPLTAVRRKLNLPGFYHVPLAGLIFGLAMLIKARRIGVLIVLTSATILVFCSNFNARMQISPLFWLSIPMLCCSIIIGTALQGLASTGTADRIWILYVVIAMGICAVAALLLATKLFQTFLSLGDPYARLLVKDATMYIVGAVALGIIFFISSSGMRLHWLRLVILASAIGLDVFTSATFIIDTIF